MHPDASGAAIGEGSLRDFRYFVSNVARLDRGAPVNTGRGVLDRPLLRAMTAIG